MFSAFAQQFKAEHPAQDAQQNRADIVFVFRARYNVSVRRFLSFPSSLKTLLSEDQIKKEIRNNNNNNNTNNTGIK